MKNFGLIGVGGYIAPRHLKAIKENKCNLSATIDINDSVGILDQYFPLAKFFLNIEKFVEFIGSPNNTLDFISICSPNFLHEEHIRLALRNQCDAICEKPIVITPFELDALSNLETVTGKKIYTILQLRHHAKLIEFKNNLGNERKDKKKHVILTYITGRGNWYSSSWKGNPAKSGGIATNIGIHLFDLLAWLFGKVQKSEVHLAEQNKMSGFLELEDACVSWFLSIDYDDIPNDLIGQKNTYRSILIDNKELEFSDRFTDLHTLIYKDILDGKGVGIAEARASIELVHDISNQKSVLNKDNLHPITKKILKLS